MTNTNQEEIGTPDSFIGTIYESGNSIVITIPETNCKFSGLKKGDLLKIWYKKTQQTQS